MDRAKLGWPSVDIMNKTLDCTTQFGVNKPRDPTRRFLKKAAGFTNNRANIIVATDTIFITQLLEDQLGSKSTETKLPPLYYQLFVELGPTTSAQGSGYLAGFKMKHKSDFKEALLDYIRNHNIPIRLFTDGAKEEDSEAIRQVLRMFMMKDTLKSEPLAQYQNPGEGQGVKVFKSIWKTISLNSKLEYDFDLPLSKWDYQADYVLLLHNYRATSRGSGITKWLTPIERSGRPTPDLSMFRFGWGEKVVYFIKAPFPFPQLHIGRSLGPSTDGNYLNQRILTDIGTVITRSAVESVANIKAKGFKPKVTLSTESRGIERGNSLDTERLEDVMDDYEPGNKAEVQARSQEHEDFESEMKKGKDSAEDTIMEEVADDQADDMSEESESELTEEEWNAKGYYAVHELVGRNEPRGDQVKRYPGIPDNKAMTERNRFYVRIAWGPGYVGQDTYEPEIDLRRSCPELLIKYLKQEFGEDPTTQQIPCIRRAMKWASHYNNASALKRIRLQQLSESGYFETEHTSPAIERELKDDGDHQVSIETDKTTIFKIGIDDNARVQYGRRCPRAWLEAIRLEEAEGVMWTQAAKEECVDKLISKYDVFEIGDIGAECPEGYQPINLKTVYTNGPDNKIKARCCAVGCGVNSGTLNRYFCVVDHANARAVMTKALADGAEIRIVDVKSAYVTCRAQEKVWVKALGPEFGKYKGRSAIVKGNLYGLNTAGAVWAASCQSTLLKLGFTQSAHDRAIYFREIQTPEGAEYEYVCTYVDDFILASKNMEGLVAELSETWEFKHSTNMAGGVRYVGADCRRDLVAQTVDISCKTYIQEALDHIEGYSKEQSQRGVKKFHFPHIGRDTPMLADDHPETLSDEDAEFLDEEDTRTYQSYIGALNWCCTLCRVDIEYSVKALSSYNAAPRVGHATRVMRIWGYLKAHPNMGIRLDPRDFYDMGDKSTFTLSQRDHLKLEYGDLEEEIDPSDPKPLGKGLTLTGFADADHAHNQVDRRSTNGRVIFLGRGILAWKSKRQVGCEGSSYGSELRAMSATASELRGFRVFLRGIGIPVKGPSLLFVDNAAALFAASNLATTLKIKHLSIDYHSVRELTAWGVIQPEKVPTDQNLADVMTKPTDRETFWRLVKSLMVTTLVGTILLQLQLVVGG